MYDAPACMREYKRKRKQQQQQHLIRIKSEEFVHLEFIQNDDYLLCYVNELGDPK